MIKPWEEGKLHPWQNVHVCRASTIMTRGFMDENGWRFISASTYLSASTPSWYLENGETRTCSGVPEIFPKSTRHGMILTGASLSTCWESYSRWREKNYFQESLALNSLVLCLMLTLIFHLGYAGVYALIEGKRMNTLCYIPENAPTSILYITSSFFQQKGLCIQLELTLDISNDTSIP